MSRIAPLRLAAAFAGGLALTASAIAPAAAQSQTCQEIKEMLDERRELVQKLNALSKGGKQADPRTACTALTKLVANGAAASKWMDANKDWCQVPDQFVTGFKEDHEKSTKIRGQACSIAAKVTAAEKQARQGGGRGGLLGGDGLQGSIRMPQGAL